MSELQNLAQSQNVALVLSLIANVVMGWVIARLFFKLEESVSAKERLLMKILKSQEREHEIDPESEDSLAQD